MSSNARPVPDEIANLYPMSNDWSRAFPWSHSAKRREHLETVYARSTYGDQKVRAAVPRSIFWNAQAALWDIANQLRRANNAARHRQTMAAKKRD
jgi:hypothetical protein